MDIPCVWGVNISLFGQGARQCRGASMSKRRWQEYEETSRLLLEMFHRELGLSHIEGEQQLSGSPGVTWNIEAKGVLAGSNEAFVIIECRQIKRRITQEQAGGLFARIVDTGAAGGIFVTPSGLQRGAALFAAARNIQVIQLSANSTPKDFAMRFLHKLFMGVSDGLAIQDRVSGDIIRSCRVCGERFVVVEIELECGICASSNSVSPVT